MNQNDHAKAAAEALGKASALLKLAESHTRDAGMNVTCGIIKSATADILTAYQHSVSWSEPRAEH